MSRLTDSSQSHCLISSIQTLPIKVPNHDGATRNTKTGITTICNVFHWPNSHSYAAGHQGRFRKMSFSPVTTRLRQVVESGSGSNGIKTPSAPVTTSRLLFSFSFTPRDAHLTFCFCLLLSKSPKMTEQFVHDVIIIGAGPCGLAVASRLCEHSPSALFTDEEHQRYHWIRKYGRRMPLKNRRNGAIIEKRTPAQSQRYSTLVLDATGDEWLNKWNRLFKTFDITHLRSPMFFHVDPMDRDSLLARAHERNQEGELLELRACVGKEISKHLRKARVKSRNPK